VTFAGTFDCFIDKDGQREKVMIFGTDYPTPDGTCVRDYVHIVDIASAHLAALGYLASGGQSDSFNLGTGHGYSVKQVIEVAREVTGHPIPAEEAPRRAGDPPCLVASAEKARKVLGWVPDYDKLETIIQTAWVFHKNHPNGYSDAADTCKILNARDSGSPYVVPASPTRDSKESSFSAASRSSIFGSANPSNPSSR
jgi:dTDP-D-glucose 4,6-dehydratase